MITLYVKGDDADRCTESFRSSIPITVTGIDGSDEHRTCTGAVTTMEYAPMPTEHDGRQWRVTMRCIEIDPRLALNGRMPNPTK